MENSDLCIPVILGTGREERRSEKAARFVFGLVEQTGVQTEFFDVRESTLTHTVAGWMDQVVTKPWQKTATRADGFIVVTPEYNHGYPGELKLFLDQALDEYNHKPLGIAGVAKGSWGGVRVVEALRTVAIELGLVNVGTAAYFPHVGDLFNEDGSPTNPEQANFVQPMIDETIWYAKALKAARDAESN